VCQYLKANSQKTYGGASPFVLDKLYHFVVCSGFSVEMYNYSELLSILKGSDL